VKIHTFCLPLPYRLGTVNSYLVETGSGFILIDSGSSSQRAKIEQALKEAGCKPGDLKLIVLTHGDFDHTGNAAYLKWVFGARIGMHADDIGMAANGDMFASRRPQNWIVRKIAPVMFRFGKEDQFEPDVFLEDGDLLTPYGLEAQVISTPGHSRGSISILTDKGDLFCGDLFENVKQPGLGEIMDDVGQAKASANRLAEMEVCTVYPGHGNSFRYQGTLV
jgi:hydroxyacylglutathione hydrolase